MKQNIIIVFYLLIYSTMSGQNIRIYPEIEKILPFPNIAVTLKPSWVKHRETLNTKYLESLDADRLLHNFRVNAGLPSDAEPLDGWEAPHIGLRGHFTGHYLSAIASLVEKYRDPHLTERLNYMVDELSKCQEVFGNGYLSAFPEKDFDTLETQYGGVWAPYYTYNKIMQGLLDIYVRTGNQKAYNIVIGMAEYIDGRMSVLDEDTIEKILYTAGANPSNEPGAMNEILYKLYRISNDPKHLSLAKVFDRDWFVTPLVENRNILSGLHSNTHIVLVNGFAQRYPITGEKKYHDATLNFWNMLMEKHIYANGSSSGPRPNVTTPTSLTAEHWGVPGHLSNTMTKEIAESCVSHNTQKLTASLFTWNPNPVFANAYMNTFYNSIMALQSGHTGACAYHLPLGSPRKKIYLKEDDFRCCNGSTIEAFTLLNSGIYYHNDSALWVNLYVPSEVNWKEKGISLEQKGEFPAEQSIEFTVSTKKKKEFTLNLFIPAWAKNVDIYINGNKEEVETVPNSYVSLHRKWNVNDKIKLDFDYDFYLKAMPDDENVIAIFYGPILLAFENGSELILKGDYDDLLQNLSPADEKNTVFRLLNNGKHYQLKPLYTIEEESYGVYATIRNY